MVTSWLIVWATISIRDQIRILAHGFLVYTLFGWLKSILYNILE
jgi:hypothetical protein